MKKNNTIYKNDKEFGHFEEVNKLPILENYFKDNLKITKTYCKYDYEGDKANYEMKSRKNNYSKYPTTLIAYDKLTTKNNKDLIFIFNFFDGLYHIKYDEIKFKNYEIKMFNRTDRGFDKHKEYIYIPISDLTKIN